MNTAATAIFRPARAHAGWLWGALVLHALASAALLFSSDYAGIFETRLDWALRMLIVAALALGLIQLSTLIVRRVAGPEIAASMRRRMLLATLVLGAAGALSIASPRTEMVLFGMLVGLAWRKWTRIPLLWLLAALIASLIAYQLSWNSVGLLQSAQDAAEFPISRLIGAADRGLSWILLAGTAFALLVAFVPAQSWEVWREDIARQAELLPFPRVLPRVLLALALAGGLWVAYAQGSQNCRWIDRATGRSSCVGALEMPSIFYTSLSFTQDGSTMLAANGDDIAVYDFPGRRPIHSWTLQEDALVNTSAIAADGSQLALVLNAPGWEETKVQIYRPGETAPFQTIVVSETIFPQIGFALDGRSLLIRDTIWDIATGAPLGPADSATRASYRTGFNGFNDDSADGSLSVQESGTKLGIYRNRYDGTIGEFLAPLPSQSTNDLRINAFSADNSLLASIPHFESSRIDIVRTSDGAPVKAIDLTPSNGTDVEALAFTPDGRHLLVARQFRQSIEIYQLP